MASATILAALLATGPAWGFDATGVDIIGLRLGMPQSEVVASLAKQGYTAKSTPEAILAKTRDGRLQVALSPSRGVTAIRYTFTGHEMGAPEKIREAVMVRFGDPNQATPPTWCRTVGSDGMCPSNQASLTFLPDELTLLLRDEFEPRP